jgi:leucyl aminopeptidase (aminopeptidase T)
MPTLAPSHLESARVREAADRLLRHCGCLVAGETVAIICDATTADVADVVAHAARGITSRVACLCAPQASMHGAEPPADVAREMVQAKLVVGLTRMSMAHSRARRAATDAGARYLSLPEYSLPLLASPALGIDFHARAPLVRRFADAFSAGSSVRVTTVRGTDVKLDITGRRGNYCPGFVSGPGELGSPPDIEANISPLETRSEGVIVVDASIACQEIGLLSVCVDLKVGKGRITSIDCADGEIRAQLDHIFQRAGSDRAYVLAECGVGLNDAAEPDGTMLMDEGALGCLHFGFGSNATVGGINEVPFHLDFVLRDPTLEVDGRKLIEMGSIVP